GEPADAGAWDTHRARGAAQFGLSSDSRGGGTTCRCRHRRPAGVLDLAGDSDAKSAVRYSAVALASAGRRRCPPRGIGRSGQLRSGASGGTAGSGGGVAQGRLVGGRGAVAARRANGRPLLTV